MWLSITLQGKGKESGFPSLSQVVRDKDCEFFYHIPGKGHSLTQAEGKDCGSSPLSQVNVLLLTHTILDSTVLLLLLRKHPVKD